MGGAGSGDLLSIFSAHDKMRLKDFLAALVCFTFNDTSLLFIE